MIYKSLTEVPNDILDLLYNLRFKNEDLSVSDYAKLYNFIVVDDVVYSTPDASERVKLFEENEHSFFFSRSLPDAIIKNGVVLKNRYGAKTN
ncbi:MAG: hypothetical protein J6X18_07350 [Bacteroidales bacterium]|nr:hypothetical protein [Bacteroidales bacterium]